jgi:chaperonin GroES
MRFEPLYERVICRPVASESKTDSGLFIPEQAQERPQEGEVLHAGCGRIVEGGKVIPLLVKAGDRILYGKFSGTEIQLNGEKLVILREDEILARRVEG